VEYGDYQCPHCALVQSFVHKLIDDFGEDLLFVFRNFPLREIHPFAMIAAQSAESAGIQGKFWEMHNLIFKNQNKLSNEYTTYLAEELGLEVNQFLEDRKSDSILNKIEHDFEEGIRSGVNGPPTFFLNKERFNSRNENYYSLYNLIKASL
jgi:protein-disulfide isomerase